MLATTYHRSERDGRTAKTNSIAPMHNASAASVARIANAKQ
jgi:hypothetical protein